MLASNPNDLSLVMWREERPNLQAYYNAITHILSISVSLSLSFSNINECNFKKFQLSLQIKTLLLKHIYTNTSLL